MRERLGGLAEMRETIQAVKTKASLLGTTAALNLPRAVILIEAKPLPPTIPVVQHNRRLKTSPCRINPIS